MKRLISALMVAALGYSGCSSTPTASQVVVSVYADPGVLARASKLRILRWDTRWHRTGA